MTDHPELMRLVRAACVLDGVCAHPTPAGVLVADGPDSPLVPWTEIEQLLGADDPVCAPPRLRLAHLLTLRRAVAALGDRAADVVGRAARPLALPVRHPLHPGPGWVHEPVPGGLLDLGLGVARLLPGQDGVLPLPPSVAAAAGLTADAWHHLVPLADRLAEFAIDRMQAGGPLADVLVGVGGCDALTLLTLGPVRGWLARARPGPLSAPRRDRVWTGAAAADREYVRAVWMLTTPGQRGIADPLRATPHGVRAPALRGAG